MGTIIGHAKIENYFVAYKGLTIRGIHNHDGIKYPVIGQGTVCYSNSSILGDATVGKNSIVAASTEIIGPNFQDNAMISGKYLFIKVNENTLIATKLFFY